MPPSAHFYYLFLPLIILPTKLYSYYITVWAIFQGFRLKAKLICYNRYYEKVGSEVKDITEELPFEIPDSWAWVRHNEIFEISGGSQPPKSKFISQPKTGYVRLYQIRDYGSNPQPIYIPENTASKISKKGDILLARYGASLGKVFWAEDGAYNVAMARVIALFDIALINKNYLYYYYKSSIYQETIMGNARSAQAGFNKDDLSKMFFPMPPLAEQVRIVSEIEKFEPLIAEYDKLGRQATKLDDEIYDKLKKSILQYAIQGKLVPQNPNDEPASVLLERIRAEKKAKLGKKYVDSYIYKGDDNCYYEHIVGRAQDELVEVPFDIPDNWAWDKISNVTIYQEGPGILAIDFRPSGTPLIRIAGMQHEYVSLNGCNYLDNNMVEKRWKHFKLDVGDIVISTSASTDKIAEVDFEAKGAIPYTGLIRFKMLECLDKDYFKYFVKTHFYAEQIDKQKSGGTIKHYGPSHLHKMIITIPPLAEQKRIVAKINEIFAML